MIVGQNVIAEADIICPQTVPVLDVPYICASKVENFEIENLTGVPPPSPIFAEVRSSDTVALDPSPCKSARYCRVPVTERVYEPKRIIFVPKIRSGSYADIGPRPSMDDEHICVDDLTVQLTLHSGYPSPSAFYGVFDGHGGPEAAYYIRKNAVKLLLEDTVIPKITNANHVLFDELKSYHCKAFLLADLALADECSVSSSCGTTALTALILGRLLLVANVGDCRAVLCRKGQAVEMSQDHRPCYDPERKRVEEVGGFIDDGYLNGCLAITRALGDWELKFPRGSSSPLIAEPEFQHVILTEDDEFLILGCDGIWDVMSNQHAVSVVRRGLRQHNDPQQSARELVIEALRLHTSDNLTAIVICFSSACNFEDADLSLRPRSRCFSLSEESRNKLKRLLENE